MSKEEQNKNNLHEEDYKMMGDLVGNIVPLAIGGFILAWIMTSIF